MKRFLALILSALLITSSFCFTASAAAVFDYNFDDFADGEYTKAQMTTLFGAEFPLNTTGNVEPNYSFNVSDGALTVTNGPSYMNEVAKFPISSTFTEGTLVFNARVKYETVSGAFAIGVESSSGVFGDIVRRSGTSFVRANASANNHGYIVPALKAVDDYYNIRALITTDVPSKYATTEKFYVEVLDMNNNGAKASSHTFSALSDIAKLEFLTYKDSSTRNGSSTLVFDTLSLKELKPEVESVSAPAGNISPRVGKIDVKFNMAFDPATVAQGIKFEKADGSAIDSLTVTPSADNKSVTLSFDALDITDYVLSITNDLKTPANEPFVEKTYNYTAAVDPLNLVTDISKFGGTDVSPNIGYIELKFNNPINPDTLEDGVVFEMPNGSKATVEMGETSESVKVAVGRVTQVGDYVLSITPALKDVYGGSLADIKSCTYTVNDVNPPMIDIDFTDLTDGKEYGYDELKDLKGVVFSSTSNFTPTAKDGGLQFVEPANKTNSSFSFNCFEKFTTGEISFDIFFRNDVNENAGAGSFVKNFNVISSNGKSEKMITLAGNGSLSRPTDTGGWYGGNIESAVKDDNGFYNLKFVFTDEMPSGKSGKYIMYIYDNNRPGSDVVWTQIYATTDNLIDITGIGFSNYKDAANIPFPLSVTLKSVKSAVNLDKIPNYVMGSTAEGASPSTDDFRLVFENAFRNITADGISLMLGNNKVASTAEIIDLEKIISITPKDYLSYGTEYTVAFPAPLQTYKFTTEAYLNRVSAVKNGGNLSVGLINGAGDEYVVIATFKDLQGNKLGVRSATTSGKSASIEILQGADKAFVNAFKVVNGAYVKASLTAECDI